MIMQLLTNTMKKILLSSDTDDDDENDSVSVLRYEKGTSFAIFNIASLLGKIDEFRIFMQCFGGAWCMCFVPSVLPCI